MIKICENVVKYTSIPVTAKTRLGWDYDSIRIIDIAQQMESIGIEALTLHARTRSQGFKGHAEWDWIRRIKEQVSIPIIGNGDVTQPQHVAEMFEQTGCDAVMIGRGAIHNPWIFYQAKEYMRTGTVPDEPSLSEKINILIDHLRYSAEYKGEKRGVLEMRKHYNGYLKGLPNISFFRAQLMQLTALDDVLNYLQEIKLHYTAEILPV
jgi:nifR3 family TIM-barrel protein